MSESFKAQIIQGIPEEIPPMPDEPEGISHAPKRKQVLTTIEKALAVQNALRYFPVKWHKELAVEFAKELKDDGRIYMRRFRPAYEMKARNIDEYPAKCKQAQAIMVMIHNNLDLNVAQHPLELITYGGNGTVFQNWAQYLITMKYLSEMTEEQTLILYSGHPLGLFPSHKEAPRCVLTNGMVVPNYSKPEDYERLAALGVTSYGQMTAGSFMYIGPQGIVHGTTITLLNAGRKYLNVGEEGLHGKTFITSGLGGMSGAQGKASIIAGAIGIIAEVNPHAAKKRYEQGWVSALETDLDRLLLQIEKAKVEKKPTALAYVGNIVDLWEKCVKEDFEIDMGSDQTSLHIPYTGGYYPQGISFDEANEMMRKDSAGFKEKVCESLRRQVAAINALNKKGMHFWDYGNAFLLEAGRAGADIKKPNGAFIYPSYVEDIMGPMCFDYGFGPFRWVCTSCDPADLDMSDKIAAGIIKEEAAKAPEEIKQQMLDNLRWINSAREHKMVVGSQARILYSDEDGRKKIALAFNKAIRDKVIKAPIVLGRDHHDVSGTDSPFRETANIQDGSMWCADMAVQNVIGDAFRGATWVSLHNGGGVGWGEVINGGFGMVLDGGVEADNRALKMIAWDVNNGITRRAWARNPGAEYAIKRAMENEPLLRVTLPHKADETLARNSIEERYKE